MTQLCRMVWLVAMASIPALAAGAPPTDWTEIIQRPHANLPLKDLGLRPLLETSEGQKIDTPDGWKAQRQRLHDLWMERLGKPPQKPDKLDVRIEKTEKLDGYTRQLLSFHSADGDRIRAYLLIPDGIKDGEKRPAVVVFHQTTKDTLNEPVGLGKNPTLAIGLHLVQRGYVVLCPECYILKGDWAKAQAAVIAKTWPGWTGMGKMTFDASRCLDFLESLAYVDRARIGCIGHSLGAKEVLYAMAFDARYKVGVFSEGGIGIRMSNWTDPWYLTERMKKHIPALEHHQVLALIAPRPILIVGGDSADGDDSWTFIHATLPVYKLLGAADRIGMINHHAKHTFPRAARQTAYRWLDHWLEFRPLRDEVGP
jgi:dienelactone hydrolase